VHAVVAELSVELDHSGELVVPHVALVTSHVGLLPGSPRQAVRAFHPTRVAQFKDALDALVRLEQEILQEVAVPDATTRRQSATEHWNGYAAALDRRDQKVDDLTLGHLGAEIEKRVFR
jgi:hypothetical protein